MSLEDTPIPSTVRPRSDFSKALAGGPSVLIIHGRRCDFCAERLQSFPTTWFHGGVDTPPVVTDPPGKVLQMRDIDVRLLAGPADEVAEQYSGADLTNIAATRRRHDGVVRYERVTDHPGDRTSGNRVRYYIHNNDFADPSDR